jgi:hypothetical protein
LDAAYREVAVAEKQWPGSMPTLDARFRIDSRYGDAKRALELQRSGTFGENQALEAFLEARIDPTEEKIDRAVAATQAMAGRDPRALGYLIQVWGEYGRTDAIYDALAKWPDRELAASTLTFFRPPLKEYRRDRRFMQVAKRAGLVDYWRSSGKWPDFCFQADQPYDCKAEAAKLS